jgi:hypothetical protein
MAAIAAQAAQARARADAAAGGPWEVVPTGQQDALLGWTAAIQMEGGDQWLIAQMRHSVFSRGADDPLSVDECPANAVFIAAARQDVPILADCVDALLAEVAALRVILGDLAQDPAGEGFRLALERGRQAGLSEAEGICRELSERRGFAGSRDCAANAIREAAGRKP